MCYHCETKLGNICCLGLKNGWLIEEQNNKKETKVYEHNLNKLTESCIEKYFWILNIYFMSLTGTSTLIL